MTDHFEAISPNPFIVGAPVRDRAMFFGREAEFELVQKSFAGIETQGLLVFAGERQSGKTSLLLQILDGRLGPEFYPVLIDMQSMAIENEMDFLGKMAEALATRLARDEEPVPPGDMIDGSNPAASFHKFVGKVLRVHPDRKLILLFDDYEFFEEKIDAGVLTEDTLFILFNLMENHPVFLVFAGSQSLEERKRDYWNIFLGKSNFHRIGHLERTDAERLITEPVLETVTHEDGAIDAIYRLAEGQAWRIQAICRSLIELLNEQQTRRATVGMVDEAVAREHRNSSSGGAGLWPSRRLPLWVGAIGVVAVLALIAALAIKLRGS